MVRIILGFVVCVLLIHNAYPQDTTYFNVDWEKTDKENAHYYRVDVKKGDKFKRTDYFMNNDQVQMQGYYRSLDQEVKTGKFKWYYANGQLRHKGKYVDNLETGKHLWYHENGEVMAVEQYKRGKLHGPFKEFYKNGQLKFETIFSNGLQDGFTRYYREDGSLRSKGKFAEGNKVGVWKYYNTKEELVATEKYVRDFLIEEADMRVHFPDTNWFLFTKKQGKIIKYTFKRKSIIDEQDRKIKPAIIMVVEDASEYKDLITYSAKKRQAFASKDIQIDSILTHEDEGYPINHKNSIWYRCHYSKGQFEHLFYMIHVISEDEKGIQIYMDMTKSIEDKYKHEFREVMESLAFQVD